MLCFSQIINPEFLSLLDVTEYFCNSFPARIYITTQAKLDFYHKTVI